MATQFGLTEVLLSPATLEKLLFEDGHSKRISIYYILLLTSSSPRMEKIAMSQWRSDITSPTEESCMVRGGRLYADLCDLS